MTTPESVDFELRQGRISDIGAMALVLERANAQKNGDKLQEGIIDPETYIRIQQRLEKPHSWSYVSIHADKVVGFVIGHPSVEDETLIADPKAEHLALLMTDPDFWGRGIATELLNVATQHAREIGNERMVLWTAQSNTRARSLYEQNGFKLIDQTRISKYQGLLVQYLLNL